MQPVFRQMATKVRSRLADRSGPDPVQEELTRKVRRLENRLTKLERELDARVVELHAAQQELVEGLQEQRFLSQRIAALGDLVAEVVSASVRGDRAELDAALARYADGL
jgi:hypothetical protein